MLSVAQARARMLGAIRRLEPESIPLHLLDGRTLAAPVHAVRDQPPFNASVMDGYALRAIDTPGALSIVGESAAGHAFARALDKGEAVRISTGAPLPIGADAVIPQEDAAVLRSVLSAPATKSGVFVRARAGDFAAGETLLDDGRVIDAGAIMAIAGAGFACAPVTRRPIISIVANGDELVAPGATPRGDQIFDAATHAVGCLARAWGAATRRPPALPDEKAVIAAALEAEFASCDIIAIIGGASVGPHDHIRSVMRDLGGELLVEGVAVRPGRPTWFAALPGHRFAIGLPGNPASALVCARIFLAPLIETMLTGGQVQSTAHFERQLSTTVPANGGREAYLRAIASNNLVTPLLNEDSSMMSVLARSNCLVCRPANSPALAAKDLVACIAWSPSLA
jgi:molybdopterin molybdotransferase